MNAVPAALRTDDCDEAHAARREYTLLLVGQLHVEFAQLGILDEAGPHLHRLMALATVDDRAV